MANKRPGRRSGAESARTRQRLLDRAERLFARKGYAGVTLRELARAAGVRPFTVQHHFGSKPALYQEVLGRWDAAVLERVARAVDAHAGMPDIVEQVIAELFDFFLEKRDWMALNARAALGEGQPPGVDLQDRSWVSFINAALRRRRLDTPFDTGLLLITIEGMLNNHLLARTHYRHLYGRDVSDPDLKAQTVAHLQRVILALLRVPVPARRRRARSPR
jgi:AcrR family transcriptional regulator